MPKGIRNNAAPTMKGQLREALLELHAKHAADGTLPTNGRFLFYELEMLGLAFKVKPKWVKGTPKGLYPDADDVSDALTSLREEGLIPWEDIVDETRLVDDYTGWMDLSVAVLSYIEHSAKLDHWPTAYPNREPIPRRDFHPLGLIVESLSVGEPLAGTGLRDKVS